MKRRGCPSQAAKAATDGTASVAPDPVYANLDVNKLSQVLINLVSNAFKFTADQGQVSVPVEAGFHCIRIEVRDSSSGIPAALLPRLFERFTPARRPGLRGKSTHGLGLMRCETIEEWQRGTISVVSTEGEGTTFPLRPTG